MKKYFQAPWTIQDLLLSLLISGILIAATYFIPYYSSLSAIIQESDQRILYISIIFVVQWVIMLAPFLIITNLKYKINWKTLGFYKVGILKTIGYIIAAYFLYLGIAFIITIFILYTDIKIPGFEVQKEILPIFGTDNLSLIIAGTIIVIIGPVIEEVFFRGFILRTLSNKTGIWMGSISSALIFAVFHMQWQSIVPIFILGLIMNGLVIRMKSLWPAIGFHIMNNAISFTLEILLIKEVIKLDQVI